MKVLHLISGGDTGRRQDPRPLPPGRLTPRMPVKMVCFTEGPFAQEARALGIDTQVLPGRNFFRNLNTLTHMVQAEGFDIIHRPRRPRQHDGGLPGQADRTAHGIHRPQ